MHSEIKVNTKEAFKQVFSKQLEIDTTIIIESGEYSITEPIEINNQISNIKIVGEENVVFKGTRNVSSKWTLYKDNIFVTTIEKSLDVEELFVDNKKYIMCRYPNYNENAIFNGTSKDAISKERVATWNNPEGGYVRSLHDRDWGGNSYRILGKNEDNALDLEWVGDNNRGSDIHKETLLVENIFQELDCELEWFYDNEDGKLYVIPEDNIDLNNCVVEYAVNSDILKIIDSKNITIQNIDFEKTNRTLFNSDYIMVTRSDWGIARRGVVYLENTENINIINCDFKNTGSNCIYLDGKNIGGSIQDCDFINTGASGIIIYGNQSCVRDLSTWEDHKTYIKDYKVGPIGDEYSKDITIKSCYFNNTGIYEKQSAPISLSVAHKITIKGCTMHKTPRAGINVCDGSFGGHIIEDNLIYDTVRETGDHGPFNSWGRDRFWSYKYFDTNGYYGDIKKPYALLDAMDTTIINHNMIIGKKGFGIDLDDGSTNYTLSNNYCNGVGIKLREGFYRTVRNNLIINAPLDLHCTYMGNDDVIEDNVIVYPSPLSVLILNDGFTTKFDNNLMIGAEETVLDTPIAQTGKNFVVENIDSDKLENMDFGEYIDFVPIDMNFGVDGKPKPEIPKSSVVQGIKKGKVLGLLISNIDESTRSVGGLANYDGVFVEDIESWSQFKAFGLEAKDTILEVNNRPIKDIDDFTTFANNSGEFNFIKIMRNQKEIILKI